uniref:Uncharacterized protein n=1 Tax=Romanomermis culicivorax TaxID=13658 RepID=A0A915JLN6_ROMCU
MSKLKEQTKTHIQQESWGENISKKDSKGRMMTTKTRGQSSMRKLSKLIWINPAYPKSL